MKRGYWLVKSDPESFSWDDLEESPGRRTSWDGVRNYEARNFIRDGMKAGDGVLVYHSGKDRAVVGTARIAKGPYPDPTQFDPEHAGYDPASTREAPRWFAVDLVAERRLPNPVPLAAMKKTKALASMVLVRRGTRLSVQPVTETEWEVVVGMGGG